MLNLAKEKEKKYSGFFITILCAEWVHEESIYVERENEDREIKDPVL